MISVIIPTLNRPQLLQRALRSLATQNYPGGFEVLVVNNAPGQDIGSIVAGFCSTDVNIRVVQQVTPGLHSGRHRGAREARGEILVFIDDDVEVTSGWLSAISECFADPSVVMVGGNNLPRFEESPPLWLRRLWDRSRYGGQAIPTLSISRFRGGMRPIGPYFVWGCNMAIRRRMLFEAGGFHPDGMPRELIRFRGDGETHVARYIANTKHKCLFHPDATVYHFVSVERMTFDYFRRRSYDQGISDSFADLRQLYVRQSQGNKRPHIRTTRKNSLRLYRYIRDMLESDGELRWLRREMSAGYQEGYAFHQQAFHDDAKVREWVLRPNYLDAESSGGRAND